MALKFANNQSLTSVTALPSAVPTDNLILISTQTASNSANISFTGINGTYDVYEFKFIDIHPQNDNVVSFRFDGSTDNGTNYGITKTTTFFESYHDEADTFTALQYYISGDLAQSTSSQYITDNLGNGSDESSAGSLILFNPSSTTYVKHFICVTNSYHPSNITINNYVAGYFNTTSAINAIKFNMPSGNFDGTIKLYGVKKS